MPSGTALPPFVAPQLATLVKLAPDDAGWLHELKFDGYRIVARLERGRARLLSRRGLDWTARLPTIRAAVEALPARAAFLDGEAAVVEADGTTRFQALQNAFSTGAATGITYFAFDLLHLDGEDLRDRPLEARKERLAALLARAPAGSPLRYSDHVVGSGRAFFDTACGRGLEGIISKRRDAPYRSGRGDAWVKTKCTARQELVIGGFTDSAGSRAGLGALLVGHHRDGALVYAGKVGTGFTRRSATELRARLDGLAEDRCPFTANTPRGALARDAHWVRPTLVAEVEFSEWTGDGHLRHPSFKGLRSDKLAREVVREAPAARAVERGAGRPGSTRVSSPSPSTSTAASASKPRSRSSRGMEAVVAGVRLSNPGRVLYPARGLTKLDLVRYLEAVAPWMLPQVAGRPLTLVHCPTGVAGDCRYLRHARTWGPAALRRVAIREKHKVGEYLVVDDVAGLVALAQMDVLEIHTWNSTTDHVEEPDRVVLDLDPGPEVAWPEVVAAARVVRAALAERGLASLVKTTGGAGLHVVAPIVPRHDVDACLAFARSVAQAIERDAPTRFTTAMPRRGRERKILLDYLRNNRTNTSVAAYSPRATAAAPVSMPLRWDELTARRRPDAFTVEKAVRRLRRVGDPWVEHADLAARQELPVAARLTRPAPSSPPPAPPAARATRRARSARRGGTTR